jgi:hypothetical protein
MKGSEGGFSIFRVSALVLAGAAIYYHYPRNIVEDLAGQYPNLALYVLAFFFVKDYLIPTVSTWCYIGPRMSTRRKAMVGVKSVDLIDFAFAESFFVTFLQARVPKHDTHHGSASDIGRCTLLLIIHPVPESHIHTLVGSDACTQTTRFPKLFTAIQSTVPANSTVCDSPRQTSCIWCIREHLCTICLHLFEMQW